MKKQLNIFKSVIIILWIILWLVACGNLPLVRPEQESKATPITTAAIAATKVVIDSSITSPLAPPTTTPVKPLFLTENLKLSKEVQLTNDNTIGHSTFGLAWSSDSKQIAFTRYSGKVAEVKGGFIQITELWIANADGTSPIKISDNGYWPEWSPDNQNIAYLSFEKDTVRLNKISLTDKQPTQLLDLTNSSKLAWVMADEILLNDKKQIQKFSLSDKTVSSFNNIPNLEQTDMVTLLSAPNKQVVAIADGTNLGINEIRANFTQISDNFYPIPGSLAWSGDSKKLGYFTNWQEIFITEMVTQKNQKVFASEGAELSGFLTLSPDGNIIAFDATINNDSGIFIINADGTGLKKLIDGYHPVWSPDGKHICFEKTDGNLWIGSLE